MLLADYSGRLAAEIDDRRQLTRTLTVFLQSQKDGLAENEQKLEVRKSFCLIFLYSGFCVYVCLIFVKILLPCVLTCVETPSCLCIQVSMTQNLSLTELSFLCSFLCFLI